MHADSRPDLEEYMNPIIHLCKTRTLTASDAKRPKKAMSGKKGSSTALRRGRGSSWVGGSRKKPVSASGVALARRAKKPVTSLTAASVMRTISSTSSSCTKLPSL